MLSIKMRVALSLCFIVLVCSFIYEYVSSFREGIDGDPDLTQNEYYVVNTLLNQLSADDPSATNTFDVSALMQISSNHPIYAKIISGNQSVADKMKSVRTLLDQEPARLKDGSVFVP